MQKEKKKGEPKRHDPKFANFLQYVQKVCKFAANVCKISGQVSAKFPEKNVKVFKNVLIKYLDFLINLSF